ncbi:MAG: sugar transferase [Pseudomonadota bacterium]|nr:sugar transferase [Pseudomonadota bacterium]
MSADPNVGFRFEPFGDQVQTSSGRHGTRGGSPLFWAAKRAFDIFFSLFLLSVALVVAVLLLIFNPLLNPGPLFFRQERMGQDCKPFKVLKFRTMTKATSSTRSAKDPLEINRITKLGHILRKTRTDELPQALNVLRGEMSVIGPRPDTFDHACEFAVEIPRYSERHSVRPGISGLAQVTLGYAVGIDATRAKTMRDLNYIRNAGFGMEMRIIGMTFRTIFGRHGM